MYLSVSTYLSISIIYLLFIIYCVYQSSIIYLYLLSSETQAVQRWPSSSFSSAGSSPWPTYSFSLLICLHLLLWSLLLSPLWKRFPVCSFTSNFSTPNGHLKISAYSVFNKVICQSSYIWIYYLPVTFLSFRSKTHVSHITTHKDLKVLWEETNIGKMILPK